MVAEIRQITGDGVRFSLETSAQPAVFREAVEALMPAGTCVLLGSARSGTEVTLDMPFLQFGRVVRGVIQGESHPQEFIPRLVDFLMQGKMPVDRMITFYPLADINRAAQDSTDGDDDQARAAHAALRDVPFWGPFRRGTGRRRTALIPPRRMTRRRERPMDNPKTTAARDENRPKDDTQRRLDRALDKASRGDSFPGSDPVNVTQPPPSQHERPEVGRQEARLGRP